MARTLRIAGFAAALLLGGSALATAEFAASTGVPMLAAQVEVVLYAHGYSDIQGLEREGDTFRIHSARRYGEPVGELQVDAVSGQVQGERMSEEQARTMLRERGFSEVSEVRRESDTILARAHRDGCEIRAGCEIDMRIDARTGAVTHQTVE
jgi:hypothetical protein